ncbi:hypothetical protein SCOR_02195 [Sulfidibacter corallicola]
MDHIAKEAGVSKLTVYNHFGTKANLFTEAIVGKCESHMSPSLFEQMDGENLEEDLFQMGNAFMDIVYSEEAMGIYRIVVQESQHDKKIAQLYHDSALTSVATYLIEYLGKLEKKKNIKFEDKARTAGIFISFFKGRRYLMTLLGLQPRPSREEQDRMCRNSLKLFMKLFDLNE